MPALLLLLPLLLATEPPAVPQDAPEPPLNVLWIIGEDLGPELAAYGTPEVRTPALDRLAAEGMRFTRAFAPAPVCSSSRSGFMTGMYPITIGAHNHRSHRDDGHLLPEGVRVITDWLRPAGYFTANLRDLTGDREERFFRGTGKTDWNFTYEGKPFDGTRWAELAEHQPFYAQVNFPETHRGSSWNSAHEQIDTPADPAKVVFPPYYPDHPIVREDWAQYLNAVMALDRKVGFLLEKLERDGLAGNTVIIFFGDHGRAMVRGKQWPYDSGLHVPLLVRWPQGVPAPEGFTPGGVSDRLVSLLDVTATTLSIAGVEPPKAMAGRVLFGPRADPPRRYLFGGRDRGDETLFRIRTVRDERYRYLRNYLCERPFLQLNRYKEWSYPVLGLMRRLHEEGALDPIQDRIFDASRPAEELYDLHADPGETVNLVEVPELRETLARLREELDRWIEEADDQGRFPEAPEVLRYWEEKMERNYGERLRRRAAEAAGAENR
jgi:N-sulfoglucosamine sulfohydrolase